jgi:hypothetical protein
MDWNNAPAFFWRLGDRTRNIKSSWQRAIMPDSSPSQKSDTLSFEDSCWTWVPNLGHDSRIFRSVYPTWTGPPLVIYPWSLYTVIFICSQHKKVPGYFTAKPCSKGFMIFWYYVFYEIYY